MHKLGLPAVLVCAFGACEGWGIGPGRASDNRAPVAVGEIEPLELWWLEADMDIAVSPYFQDPDGDPLAFAATLVASSDPAARSLAAYGDFVVLRPIAARPTATVVVTASDPGGLMARQRFGVTVANDTLPPAVLEDLNSKLVPPGFRFRQDVSVYFADSDGDVLTFTAASTRPQKATVSLVGSAVVVEAKAPGSAAILVTATDPGGLPAYGGFKVVIR